MDILTIITGESWFIAPKSRGSKSRRNCNTALSSHTTYIRNNMGQKCEGNCGLWVLNEMIKKIYPENLKKNVGAVWELVTC